MANSQKKSEDCQNKASLLQKRLFTGIMGMKLSSNHSKERPLGFYGFSTTVNNSSTFIKVVYKHKNLKKKKRRKRESYYYYYSPTENAKNTAGLHDHTHIQISKSSGGNKK